MKRPLATRLLRPIRRRIDRRLSRPAANFWLHVSEGAFATFGGELVGAHAVLPAMVAALGASATALGLMTSIGQFAFMLPMLFAHRIEPVRRKKRLVMLLGAGQRLPLLLIVLALGLLAEPAPWATLWAVAACQLMISLSVGVLVAPWLELIAETVPAGRIGRLFGFRHAISAAFGLASGGATMAILGAMRFPRNFQLLYVVSFISMAVSYALFALVDDIPAGATPHPARPPGQYFRRVVSALRDDRLFRRYVAFQALGRIGMVAGPFFVFAAIEYLGMDKAVAAGTSIVAGSAAGILGNLALPFLTERIGHRAVIAIGVLAGVSAAVVAAVAPSASWFVAVFILVGVGAAAGTVAGMPFMMAVFPRGRRIGYMSLARMLLSPIGMGAAVAGGAMITRFGHRPVFLGAAAVMLTSLVPLWLCRPEDRGEQDDDVAGAP